MIYVSEAQKIREKQEELCPKCDDKFGHKVFARRKISLMTAISTVYLVVDYLNWMQEQPAFFFYRKNCLWQLDNKKQLYWSQGPLRYIYIYIYLLSAH